MPHASTSLLLRFACSVCQKSLQLPLRKLRSRPLHCPSCHAALEAPDLDDSIDGWNLLSEKTAREPEAPGQGCGTLPARGSLVHQTGIASRNSIEQEQEQSILPVPQVSRPGKVILVEAYPIESYEFTQSKLWAQSIPVGFRLAATRLSASGVEPRAPCVRDQPSRA